MNIYLSDYTWGSVVATDLVNTSPLVRRSSGDVLTDAPALAQFLTEHGIRPSALAQEAVPTEKDLLQVRALRQDTRALLEATNVDEVVEGATALVARSAPVLTLHHVHDRCQWALTTPSRASVADELATLAGTGLLGVLHALGHDRFRPCASPECDGTFVDTSKAGRRRYCMPDVCGNRVNVARHRARQRQGTKNSPRGQAR